jgi:hypothetical protein
MDKVSLPVASTQRVSYFFLFQEEDALDRELQSTELARIMAATPNPVIFLGYVVTTPHSKRRMFLCIYWKH